MRQASYAPGPLRGHKHLGLAVLLAAAASGAHAEIIEIRWSAEGRFEQVGPIAAGQFVELCGKLPAGLAVRWDFKADTPVDFNVHYHVGKDVVFPFKLRAITTGANTLHTKVEQDYCWMWTNKSAAAAMLSARLQR